MCTTQCALQSLYDPDQANKIPLIFPSSPGPTWDNPSASLQAFSYTYINHYPRRYPSIPLGEEKAITVKYLALERTKVPQPGFEPPTLND